MAGREQRLNTSFNRLLLPQQWGLDSGRLVFLEENQSVVYWGVPLGADDPIVEMGVPQGEGLPLEWSFEHRSCADFLLTHLYVQASFGGGLKYTAMSVVQTELQERLEQQFQKIGQMNDMHVYGREAMALSFLQMDDEWHLYAGFTLKKHQ